MFKGVGQMQGVVVQDADALDYALESCGVRHIAGDKENPMYAALLDAIKDWFYSGSFCHYEDDDPEICQSEPEEDGPDPDEEYERYLDIDQWEDYEEEK